MSSCNDIDKNKLCQQYLNIVYHDIKARRDRPDVTNLNMAETYGEILPNSVDRILSEIQLTSHDIFVDLGSGIGKITAQFFLKSDVQEAYGIEILSELHKKALLAEEKIQHDLPDFYAKGRKLLFLQGDFLNLPLSKATVVMICAPCYSQDTLAALGKIIENTPSIHTVLTLRPLPALSRLSFKKAVRIECSWDTALCYIYAK